MNKINFNTNETVDYIADRLYTVRQELLTIKDAKFHHNTSYQNAPLVCEHGILTLLDLNKLGIRNDSLEMLERLNDNESHINGNNGVSLSVVGLTDLYKDEFEYDPFNPKFVDILLSSQVRAYRNSRHYGNEYISSKSIEVDKIKAIDVRMLEYIDKCNDKEELIDMYNNLIEVARIISNNNLDIQLREMSYSDNFSLSTTKLALSKKLDFEKSA